MTVESKASKEIAQRLAEIEPGTPRYEVLEVAKHFKTSWMDLGAKLWEVRRKKLFEEWGFADFDSYCQSEIRIKPRTAAKLTASYGFLKEAEPTMLKRDGVVHHVPDVETVEVLRRAREGGHVAEPEYRRLRDLAFEDTPVAALRRELKAHLPPPEPPSAKDVIKKVVTQAERLANTLAMVQGIPRIIVDRALAMVDDLRALVG